MFKQIFQRALRYRFDCAPGALIVGPANTNYETGERNLLHPLFEIGAEIKVEKK